MKHTCKQSRQASPACRHTSYLSLRRNPLILGTMILTLTGLISRVIGFFYRIFLSHLFGAEGMGIYQLIAPVTAFVASLTASGLQTAVSKLVAGEPSTKDYKFSFRIVVAGFTLSVSLSFLCCILVYRFSEQIAASLLLEPRCAALLRIVALSFPFGAAHAIINGYFYGIKSTKIPAITQLVEQLIRVGSVFAIFYWADAQQKTLQISAAVVGLVIGEMASMCISLIAIYHRFYRVAMPAGLHAKTPAALYQAPLRHKQGFQNVAARLLALAVPLSFGRIIINLLQSVEAIYIPAALRSYGLSASDSLSIYGVLTGMALPLILFPSALIGSLCVLLLPVVSEAQEAGHKDTVRRAKDKTVLYCSLFGALCTLAFLTFGKLAGTLLFHSSLAGTFIQTLSFICPFLYLSATLSSILNGLGKTGVTFLLNVGCLGIRLLFIFAFVPRFGIAGYLWGLLISQLTVTFFDLAAANYFIRRL